MAGLAGWPGWPGWLASLGWLARLALDLPWPVPGEPAGRVPLPCHQDTEKESSRWTLLAKHLGTSKLDEPMCYTSAWTPKCQLATPKTGTQAIHVGPKVPISKIYCLVTLRPANFLPSVRAVRKQSNIKRTLPYIYRERERQRERERYSYEKTN